MPIHGLSDRRRLSRLGKIKTGVLVHPAQGKPYPRATDYFVVPPIIQKVHGEQPRELPVMLPSDNPEEVFPQELKAYKASGLFCAGDGQRAKRWQEGKLVERDCPCELLDRGECRPTAILNLLLPDVPGLGVWQLTVRNREAIVEINTALDKFAAMFGGLRGVPLVLRLEKVHGQRYDPQKKAQVKVEFYAPKLDTKMTLTEIFQSRQALGAAVDRLMLPAMGEIEDDDAPETESSQAEAEMPIESSVPVESARRADPPASQHNDPAPPEAAEAKVVGDGSALLIDEVVTLAQRIDVDEPTARAWISYVLGSTMLPKADELHAKILWLKEVAQSPQKAAAAKAAMKAGARKAPASQERLV